MTQRDTEQAFAAGILRREAAAVASLAEAVAGAGGEAFRAAVDLIVGCADRGGTLQVTGLGKSGHIGAKISATLASLGIPSHAVHPSEAAHGDLGRFRDVDVALAISFSGETDEVVNLVSILRQDGLPVITITGGGRKGEASTLERLATVALTLGLTEEAGAPECVAPTSSTTATLALGDALALAAARRRNFTREDFARRHPGGTLGDLLRPVREVLRFVAGKNLPLVSDDVTVEEALRTAAEIARRPGAIVLVDRATGRLTGLFTDGDLRRLVLKDARALTRRVSEVMTRTPRTLGEDALVRDAVRMVREHRSDEIPVVDSGGRPVGVLDVQDLVTMRLVKD